MLPCRKFASHVRSVRHAGPVCTSVVYEARATQRPHSPPQHASHTHYRALAQASPPPQVCPSQPQAASCHPTSARANMHTAFLFAALVAASLTQVTLATGCGQDSVQCFGEPATAFNSSWLCCAPRWRCTWLDDGAPRCQQMLDEATAGAPATATGSRACAGRMGTRGAGVTVGCPDDAKCGYTPRGWPVCTEARADGHGAALRGAGASRQCRVPSDAVCSGAPSTSYASASTCCPSTSRCAHLDDGSPVCLMQARDMMMPGAADVCCEGEPASPGAGHTVCCGPRSTCGYLNDGFPLCREL